MGSPPWPISTPMEPVEVVANVTPDSPSSPTSTLVVDYANDDVKVYTKVLSNSPSSPISTAAHGYSDEAEFKTITPPGPGSGINDAGLLNGVLQPQPISGIFALLVAIACTLFSLAILVASNDQPIDSWKIQPTVFLAIATALANAAVACAYARAVPVAWWYRAVRVASVRTLEYQWEASTYLSRAVLRGKEMSFVIVAAMLVPLIIIDGPLIQRASSTRSAVQAETYTMNITLSPEVPSGFSGIASSTYIAFSNEADAVNLEWSNQVPINLPSSPACKGRCVAKVKGPGVAMTNRTTTVYPVTKAMWWDSNATWGGQGEDESRNPLFRVSLRTHFKGEGQAGTYLVPAILGNASRILFKWHAATLRAMNCNVMPKRAYRAPSI